MTGNIAAVAMDIGDATIANKVVSTLTTGTSRGVGITNTSIDFAKTIASPRAQNAISTSPALNTVSGQNLQGGNLK